MSAPSRRASMSTQCAPVRWAGGCLAVWPLQRVEPEVVCDDARVCPSKGSLVTLDANRHVDRLDGYFNMLGVAAAEAGVNEWVVGVDHFS